MAGAAVMAVVEGQWLLPVSLIFRMIEVKYQGFGRSGMAGDELLHHGLACTIYIAAGGCVFEARNGRTRG